MLQRTPAAALPLPRSRRAPSLRVAVNRSLALGPGHLRPAAFPLKGKAHQPPVEFTKPGEWIGDPFGHDGGEAVVEGNEVLKTGFALGGFEEEIRVFLPPAMVGMVPEKTPYRCGRR